jgi:hypothetical protein
MVEFKKFLWTLPIFSAILALIGLITPVAYVIYSEGGLFFWLWALNIRTNTGEIWFNTDTLAMVGAVTETIVIILAIVIILFTVFQVRKGEKNLKRIKILWLICGFLLTLAPIGYIIGAEFYISEFWTNYSVGFGIIGPFIAAAIIILGIFFYKD